MASSTHPHGRLPAAVRQGLTLLSGNTIAKMVPAVAAPLLTRLYHPTDFGTFAFVLAVFSLAVTNAAMRMFGDAAAGLDAYAAVTVIYYVMIARADEGVF